jgi:archaellum biogenesis ATPase FlaH
VLSLSDKQRINFLNEPRWIGYPTAQKLIELLRHMMELPTRARMPNLLIVGDSNNGKTTIIDRFKELHGKGYVNENAEPVKPVIIVESPPTSDEKALYASILEEFWTPYRVTDSVIKLRYQVIHLLRECNVKILIIDELHSLLSGSAIKQREMMNAIKMLCNEVKIPVVGVGTSDAVRVLHTDPQHASRFDVLSLRPWSVGVDFQRFLKGFESVLPLRQASELFRPEVAYTLHAVSEGNTGNLHRLLIECATEAINSGKEKIDVEMIKSKSWLQPTRGIRELM